MRQQFSTLWWMGRCSGRWCFGKEHLRERALMTSLQQRDIPLGGPWSRGSHKTVGLRVCVYVCVMDGWIDVRVYIPSVVCMNSLKKKYYDKWMRNNQNEEFTNKLQSNLLHFALLFLLRLYVFYSFFAHWNWAKTLLDESMTLFCCFSVISRGTHHENSQPS